MRTAATPLAALTESIMAVIGLILSAAAVGHEVADALVGNRRSIVTHERLPLGLWLKIVDRKQRRALCGRTAVGERAASRPDVGAASANAILDELIPSLYSARSSIRSRPPGAGVDGPKSDVPAPLA